MSLNILNFRFIHPKMDQPTLNALNKEILVRLQESGLAVVSGTTLDGRFVLGEPYQSTQPPGDFDLLVAEVVRLGRGLLS